MAAATTNLGIVDYQLPDDTHNLYDVTFFTDQIHTLVTRSPFLVDSWISEITPIHLPLLHPLIVGLDIEWRPNKNQFHDYPAATLQLCVGCRCLIFQLIYSPEIPQSLFDFLSNPIYTFVGVGIHTDVDKLTDDYGLSVATPVDLRSLAVDCGMIELRNAGLKTLAREVLGKEIEKPKRITTSRWDNKWLYPEQVQYACIDAFLSFEIGRCLNAAGF
ncbi:Werner Syndrome-like exonuclease [Camellia lanceoleosa]|uniref:Werner Syndrome-like exonuclease n=1 Tax=Camellia lanceoleosa TaxID=1840588 RepID=A0ACC0GCU9_9ERIC|nr:Werner Syndrome-like exonuclease [Camellia lanceoleosa]